MRTTQRWISAVPLLAATLLAGPAPAQQQLTVERIFGSDDFRARRVDIRWTDDGRGYEILETGESGRGTDLWVEGISTGRTRMIEGATLTVADSAAPIEIEEYSWSADRRKLLVFTNTQRVWRANTKGTYYVYDVGTRRLTPISARPGWQMYAKLSPDGNRVGFVRDNDLYVTDLSSGRETRLTTDGSDSISNGSADWVYEEELGVTDAWRWSPDGQRIAYLRFDQRPVRTFYLIDELELYSDPFPIRYPKPGTPNSQVTLGVIDLAAGRTTWMDAVGASDSSYIARIDFAGSPTELLIQRLNRHQNRLDLLLGDVATGRTRGVLSETDSAWVDVDDDLTWLAGGRQFLWTSERDGFNHVYLYDRSGRLVRQVTSGAFDVSAINGVDERNGTLFFTAAHPTPMERQLYRVGLNGRGLRRITAEPGTHGVNLSPDATTYLDAWSRAGSPTVYRLHSAADGRVIRVLEDNAALAATLRTAGVTAPEFFRFTTSDGVELNGTMIKPQDFDPAKRYPVLMYVYGGPGSQTVVDAWGGNRFLWHSLLAERGYIVVSVDNRGTGARGRDFKKLTYLNLGKWETNDQIEAARHLVSLPYVDRGRIGIWGWSYGGYMTALTLMRGGTLFKGGISVAPVTHWGLYDSVYTERFMRTPQENPEGYRETAPLNHVERLQSDLLLVHGTGDDNVHFQNSTQLVARLQAAGKPFEFMMYPNQTHSISDSQQHLFGLMTAWVLEHL